MNLVLFYLSCVSEIELLAILRHYHDEYIQIDVLLDWKLILCCVILSDMLWII